ncbi:MAG: hypothetical protein JWP08_2230 [Bryobacterales bacterium]|nr:hypothetical protein [Bryobacterales bacterium]
MEEGWARRMAFDTPDADEMMDAAGSERDLLSFDFLHVIGGERAG